jgi:hypothetical protein
MNPIQLIAAFIFLSMYISAQIISSFSLSSEVVGATVALSGEGYSTNLIENAVNFNGALATIGPLTEMVNGTNSPRSSILTVLENNSCHTISRY